MVRPRHGAGDKAETLLIRRPSSELLQDLGSPMPDSEAVRQTLSRLLRPGTLVFVLPASESIPQP